jgi:copper chaperone NosL
MSASVPPDVNVPWQLAGARARHEGDPVRFPAFGRWCARALIGAGALLILLSYFAPWWSFTLYAPQYPRGLRLVLSLSELSGDVHEVNMLNHYIGMKSLALAAPVERALAFYGVMGLGLAAAVSGLFLGPRWRRLSVLLALLLPLGFLVDSWLWLRHFGHALDPRAPIELAPFTPQMFGNGEIGQFLTFASPQLGFALAVLAPGFIALGLWLSKQPVVSAEKARAR